MKPGIGLRVAIASGIVVLLALVGIGGWYATKRFERRRVEARDREERKEALDKKLTQSSTRDATRELVDEDFQFRIDWPGPGYKVMGEDEARRVVPEAFGGVLGVGDQASCSLAVTAELVPGAPLETLGELYRDATNVQDKVVERFERGELEGQPAFFVDISGVVQGTQTTWKQAIVTRNDWAIRATVWTKPGREKACNGFLEQNFHLLPGAVRGRTHRAHIPDEERTHYRVKDRHFEAPLAGVEATLPPDVDLSVGDREGGVDPDGLFTLSKRSVQVMIRIEGAAGGDEKTYGDSIVRAVASALGSVDEATPPLSVDAFGHALSLRKIEGPAFDSWLGATLDHGVAIRVRFNFPKGLGAQALDSAREMLALVRPMSKSDAARVAGELPAVDPIRTSRVRRSLRSGTFIDFDLGCRAQLPRGPWIPFLDTTSSGIATPASLALRRPDEGLRALVVHRDASDDLASDQRGLLADLATLPVS
ncbi:MAG TPA: hypothetical protein VL400_00230, partial [Polyangiaceae bacterium]|nr:hypothetical protein [Polyangiaceae bacterium]